MEVRKMDKSNMYKIILDFPKQFQVGIEAAKNIGISNRFDKVLICAMGGSALPGDILGTWLADYKIKLPLYIHRDYGLPHYVDKKHLIICISYSGNTEEILNSFEEARAKKYKIIAITSNGRLAELCKKYRIPAAIIPPPLIPPRLALGVLFAALLQTLINHNLLPESYIKEILKIGESLSPKKLGSQGKELAKKLKNKVLLIYASDKLKALAQIWKINFNENSKTFAFSNCIPEMNHNEINGFENSQGKFHLILLHNPSDHPRIQKRMKLTADIAKRKGINVDIINIRGKDILHKVFSNILLANWTSYWLALEYKIDPTPVKVIEELKQKLKRK